MNNNFKSDMREIKISDANKILRRYRNLNLTYDLIRKIVEEMDGLIIRRL